MLKVRLHREARDPGAVRALPLAEGAAPPAPLRAAAAAARFTGKAGQVVESLVPAPRTLLVGAGPGAAPLDWERAGGEAAAHAGEGTRVLALDARGLPPGAAAALAAGACLRAWRFERHRTRDVKPGLERLELIVDRPRDVAPFWQRAAAAVRGCLLARDLVAEPANRLSPAAFAERMEGLAAHGLAVEVLGPKRLARLGFGALLAVGGGSANPPHLVVLRWKGTTGAAPVVFVGKGITFDTGGVSIKPAAGMEEMRADMAGAAACAGAMLALALRGSPAPAAAVLALAENAVGAASYRPGDVLRTLSGRTVEVLDTDAEGRLVLADALHYAATRLRPRAIVDVATLTGAIVTALGHHRAGLFATDAALAAQLAAAGEAVGEPVWPMPIGERHREDLRSDIADLRQCAPHGSGVWGGRFLPDACHAAAFLREFAEGVPWAHLDIAGVELRREADALGIKGASGFGARLLDALVAMRFEEAEG
ncbi:putative cytosol aminopeptidase [Caldovatus sediminis]|uniref:Putative cytosol aminopeptidase n=1 Tax=Caldovatus sediminis TaxID=2041189 RepID=A0A8J2Z8Q9_9PROT|nr:leucyl aminopeptidase [Caldovatus sediminis]GGG21708.1 putative cytosol aminopeptidase [Caldovatus sediminis]